MNGNCRFCDISDFTEKATLETGEKFRIVLDPFPASFGHCLIIPKRHVEKFEGLEKEELGKLPEIIERMKSENGDEFEKAYREVLDDEPPEKSARMIKEVLNSDAGSPDGYNIGVNQGRAAGQTVDHLHIHLIPRYEGDVDNPEGGVRNVIPEKADYT